MKKYLLKLFLFSLLFISLSILNRLRYNYYEGSKMIKYKVADFHNKNKEAKFNTLFFGSSHIFRQVNPILFDKKNNEKGVNTKSYNFATWGCNTVEQFYLVNQFLKNENTEYINDVFFELLNAKEIDNINLYTKRGHYYVNNKSIDNLINTIRDQRFNIYLNYFFSYLLNFLNYRSTFYYAESSNSHVVNVTNLSLNKNGFLSLTEEAAINPNTYTKRVNYFKNNSKFVMNNVKKYIKKAYYKSLKFYLDEMNILAIKYPNIKFHAVCHPMNLSLYSKEYKNINVISMRGKAWKNLISKKENYFDKGHLSEKGANIFTTEISNQYISNKMAKRN